MCLTMSRVTRKSRQGSVNIVSSEKKGVLIQGGSRRVGSVQVHSHVGLSIDSSTMIARKMRKIGADKQRACRDRTRLSVHKVSISIKRFTLMHRDDVKASGGILLERSVTEDTPPT